MWRTEALGKNGWQYFLLIYMLPVLPISMAAFAWYIFYSAETLNDIPMPIVVIVFLIITVFLHQTYDVFKFVKIASKTAKLINIKNNTIELMLFSNKVITSDDFTFISEKGEFSKTEKYKGLFALDEPYATVMLGDKGVFYISGKTEQYKEMCREILAISEQ